MLKKTARYLFCLMLGVALPASFVFGGDWPQYKRNAARTGDAVQEALEVPMTRVTAVRFPSPIYASPAVVAGKVYIQDARGNVGCIDAAANKVVWLTELGGINNMSSPAVAGGKVFVGSTQRFLAVLDAETGNVIKKIEAADGVIASPAVENGHVYFSALDGALTKTNMEGNVVWTFHGLARSYAEFAVNGNEIVYAGGDEKIAQSNVRRGRRGRSCHAVVKLQDEGTEVKLVETVSPTFHPLSGLLFGPEGQFATGGFDSEHGRFEGFLGAEKIFSDAHRRYQTRATASCRGNIYYRGDLAIGLRGNQVWQADPAAVPLGGYHSSPALAKNFLVIGTELGAVQFFDIAKDGQIELPEGPPPKNRKPNVPVRKPAWSFQTTRAGKSNGAVSSSPAIAGGRVYFGGEDGVLYGLGAGDEAAIVDALAGKPAAERTPPGSTLQGHGWSTAGGGATYSCVSPDTTIKPPFRIKWRTRVWDVMKGPVIVGGGTVFRASRFGQVAALDAESGEIVWRAHHPDIESWSAGAYADGALVISRGGAGKGGGLWCHDAKTGDVVWHKDVPIGRQFHLDGPAVHQGLVFTGWWEEKGMATLAAYRLADGAEAWKETHEIFPFDDKKPRKRPFNRFSTAAGDGRFYVSVYNEKKEECFTMAVDAKDGSPVWTTTKYTIWATGSPSGSRCRIALRNGILVVFGEEGGQALDATSGQYLWTGGGSQKRPYYGAYHMTPLTDGYLESKGTRNIFESGGCRYGVYANGVWYGHQKDTNVVLAAFVEKEDAGKGVVMEEVWSYSFLSRACPSPAIAYGRLYYSPNGEGVVYCFEPE